MEEGWLQQEQGQAQEDIRVHSELPALVVIDLLAVDFLGFGRLALPVKSCATGLA